MNTKKKQQKEQGGGFQCDFWIPASTGKAHDVLLKKIRSFLNEIGVNDNECELCWYRDDGKQNAGPAETYNIREYDRHAKERNTETEPVAGR